MCKQPSVVCSPASNTYACILAVCLSTTVHRFFTKYGSNLHLWSLFLTNKYVIIVLFSSLKVLLLNPTTFLCQGRIGEILKDCEC